MSNIESSLHGGTRRWRLIDLLLNNETVDEHLATSCLEFAQTRIDTPLTENIGQCGRAWYQYRSAALQAAMR